MNYRERRLQELYEQIRKSEPELSIIEAYRKAQAQLDEELKMAEGQRLGMTNKRLGGK